MQISSIGGNPGFQAASQAAAAVTAAASAADSDGDTDGSGAAASIPSGSTFAAYA